MGNSSRKPYIYDEFESDDENYESAAENIPEETSSLLEDVNEIKTIEESSPIDSSGSTVKGLKELLKFLEAHDYEGAQRLARHLQKSNAFSTRSVESIEYDYPHESPSAMSSSWSSKPHEKAVDFLNSNEKHQEAEGKVLDDDHQKVLAQLDEDLRLFEANEEKISSDASVFHSGIPRLRPSSAALVGGSSGSSTDVTKRTQSERRRSPSPGSRLKASGIPRYAWAQAVPPTGNTCSGNSDVRTGDSSNVSKVCECLPEAMSKVHATTGRKTFSKPFAGDNHPGFTQETSSGSTGNETPVSDEKTIGSFPTWDINISEFTGRVKTNKKRSGLPSPWSRSEDHHTATKDHSQNETEHGISSVSTELVAGEVLNKTAREHGEISQRKFLDLKRWYCISRPQYKTSCGISSVVSCWNYLFSVLGHGSCPPLTQEAAMKLLGYAPPFDIIQFGPVTGNRTLLRWFNQLNTHFQVRGKGYFMFKPSGKNQTPGVTDEMAWDLLKKGLKDPDMAFIYHCHNHYFCPIGIERTPQFCVEAYTKGEIGEPSGKWVLIGDTSRKHPPIHCKSWEDICLDLHCKSPSYFNIRQNWKGVLQYEKFKTKTIGNNLHCILAFHKVSDKPPANLILSSSSSPTSPKHRLSRLPTSSTSPPHSPVTSGPQLSPDASKDEVESEFDDSLEDDEVGYENLDSEDDNVNEENDDNIQENNNGNKVDENERPVKVGKENDDDNNVDEKKRDVKVVEENDMTDD